MNKFLAANGQRAMSYERSAVSNTKFSQSSKLKAQSFFVRLTTLLALFIFLSACTQQESGGFLGNRLAPCAAAGSPFEGLAFKDWPETYHSTVDTIVEAHLETIRGIGKAHLNCTADNSLAAFPPSFALNLLAASLPPWEAQEQSAGLSELHIGAVLMEYLRVYECANLERRETLSVRVNERENGIVGSGSGATGSAASGSGGLNPPAWNRGPFTSEVDAQRAQIERELAVARPALERTLDVIGSIDQLLPVEIETECIKRASVNMRNAAGLLTDALSCSTKIPGKSSLRDPPPLNP